MAEHGFDPQRLEIEVTETALVENGNIAKDVLEALKALGFKLSLDDFGTGYSSMTYLQKFPFDKIKIDRSFVMDMNTNPTSRAIVNAVIGLGHGLKMPIVAEGVETEEQASSLRHSKCEELQGYLIGRPAPLDTFASEIAVAGVVARANVVRLTGS